MRRLVAAAVVLTALYAAALTLIAGPRMRATLAAVAVPVWSIALAVSWWALRGEHGSPRRPLLTVAALALVVQLPGLVPLPVTSTDTHRYALDGRMVLDGRNPYAYAPLDDRIAALRDPVLFPGLGPADHTGFVTSPLPRELEALVATTQGDARVRIFLPRWPTPYPPAAEAWYGAVAAVTPWSLTIRGFQLADALLVVGTTVLLARMLQLRSRPPWPALLVAWSPTAVLDLTNGGHVDALAMPVLLLAVLAAWQRRSPWLVGALLAGAVLLKLTPFTAVPAFAALGTRQVRSALVVAGTVVVATAAAYLPFVLTSGSMPFEGVVGYARSTNPMNRAVVLRSLLPDSLVPWVLLLVAGILALVVLLRGDPHRPEHGALVLLGGALLLTTPAQSWYVAMLLPLIVLTRRWEWLAAAVAGFVAYGAIRRARLYAWAWIAATAIVGAVGVGRARRESLGSSG